MTPEPSPLDHGQPIRKSIRRLRWFVQGFRAQMEQMEQETGLRFALDAGKLSAAFLDWLRAFETHRPDDPADRRAYTGFAAGLMLRTLLDHGPARLVEPGRATPSDVPEHFWPEGFLYVSFCLNVRAAVLAQDFHEKQRIVPELTDLRTWWSFKENTAEDVTQAIGFLDLFAGETPDWEMPGLFRSKAAQNRALTDAKSMVALGGTKPE
ncbi:hypothetical protein [Oceaniglobus ichthyenteri]|uniref:hypothetical protein n=1 Tax=Oceaniglobus ichthyenteri TaxID=2136177 RepID=UPI0019810C7F|nr:hypothetical protein [Oceaniglobus ichthyenteri]